MVVLGVLLAGSKGSPGRERQRSGPLEPRVYGMYKYGSCLDGEEEGAPSRWMTLRALRVLQWWDGQTASSSHATEPPSSVSIP